MTSIEKKMFNKNGEWKYKKFEEDITVGNMYLLGDPTSAQTAIIECVKVPYKKDKNLYYEKKYRLLFSDFEEIDINNIENQNPWTAPTNRTKVGDVSRNYNFRVVLSSITDLPVACNLILRFYNHYLVVLVKLNKKVNQRNSTIWCNEYMRFNFKHDSGIKNKLIQVPIDYYAKQYYAGVGIVYMANPEVIFTALDFTKNYLKKL
jgi:hypothetical protein